MAKLSKVDQRAVNMATMQAQNGNIEAARRILQSLVRSSNTRSEPLLRAELAKFEQSLTN